MQTNKDIDSLPLQRTKQELMNSQDSLRQDIKSINNISSFKAAICYPLKLAPFLFTITKITTISKSEGKHPPHKLMV